LTSGINTIEMVNEFQIGLTEMLKTGQSGNKGELLIHAKPGKPVQGLLMQGLPVRRKSFCPRKWLHIFRPQLHKTGKTTGYNPAIPGL